MKPALVTFVFLFVVSIIPVYNKSLYKTFDYPLTATAFYLLICALVGLAIVGSRAARGLSNPLTGAVVRTVAPLGVAFGVKLGLTNYGLALITVSYHVLFGATAIVWVILFSTFGGERPTGLAVGCVALMVAGQFCLSWELITKVDGMIAAVSSLAPQPQPAFMPPVHAQSELGCTE